MCIVAGCTPNPSAPWVTQQARQLTWTLAERPASFRFLIRDRDQKFTDGFDEVFRSEGIEIIRTPFRAPQANGVAERFVRTVRSECLDWLLILNDQHLSGSSTSSWSTTTATGHTERWPSRRPIRHARPSGRRRRAARLVSSVAIVSVVWFTSTSWRRDQVSAPYRFFSPPDYRRSTLDPQRVTEALRTGVNRVPSIEVALIADLVRDRGVEHARNLLERMGEVRNHGVIGIGIGGFEPGFPPELFEATFERARALGFRTTAHAGEAAGAASVWGAVRALRVDRIGHATRAAEDPELVKHLAARRIPLELCPLSNVRTGVIKSVEAHPLRQYFDAGIPVSLNTDDPLFFGNSLAMELESAQRAHRFTRDEIRRLMLSSVEATWLSADRKKRLAADFQRDPSWNDAGA